MKTYFAFLLLLLPAIMANAQWQADQSFTTPGATANNISFVSAWSQQDRFVMECDKYQSSWSSNGLYRTTDDGNTWFSSIGSELCPGAVFFLNKDTGYLVAIGSAIGATRMAKTIDGGNSWQDINYIFPTTHQKGLFFVNESIGYYGSGDGYTIYKTTDGGTSWAAKNTGPDNAVFDVIHFFNKDTGIIAGWYGPKIARTTDGGDTWVTISNNYGIYAMSFPTGNTGYAVGANGTNTPVIVKTTDAGNTWNEVYAGSFPKAFFFSSIYCLDDKNCYAIGDSGTILRTKDAGITWHKEASGTQERLNSVSCTKTRACYIAGNGGVMLKNVSETGIADAVNTQDNVLVYPNPFTASATIQLAQSMQNGTLYILDLCGRTIKQINDLQGDRFLLSRQDLSAGSYFFVLSDKQNRFNGRFAVE